MADHDHLKSGIDRLVPILGWITLIAIALLAGLLVLGMMTFAVWLAILFFIKILPFIILVAIVAVIWKLLQERRLTRSRGRSSGSAAKDGD